MYLMTMIYEAVCCLGQLPGPVQLENVKEQYLKHHGHKCLGTEETDETFLCSDIGFNVWCL